MKWDRDALESPHTRRDNGQIEINIDPAYVREFAATCSYTERQMILALLGKLEEAKSEVERHQSDRPFIIGANSGFDACLEQNGPPRWWKTCDECHRPQGQPHAAICPYGPGTVIKSQTFWGCR